MYVLLAAWGIAAAILSLLNWDSTALRVNVVAFMIVSTITHYGVSLGSATAVKGAVSYPVQATAFRAIDVMMLAATSTLVIFFLNTETLFAVPLVGSMVTSVGLAAQVYKVGSIVQGILGKTRAPETGKLLSDLEY